MNICLPRHPGQTAKQVIDRTKGGILYFEQISVLTEKGSYRKGILACHYSYPKTHARSLSSKIVSSQIFITPHSSVDRNNHHCQSPPYRSRSRNINLFFPLPFRNARPPPHPASPLHRLFILRLLVPESRNQ